MGVNVYLWGRHVGALVQTSQGSAFEYTPEFKKSGLELSPVNLPLEGKAVFAGEPVWQATSGIPGVFYDSLPDRFGSSLLDIYFSEKGLNPSDIDVFTKLKYIGDRGMGALEYRPETDLELFDQNIDLREIEKISRLVKEGKKVLKTNIRDKKALMQILHVGTSAGGARAKALIAVNKKDGTIKSGQVDWGDGYRYCLLKIDGANQKDLEEPTGYGRLEYSYYQMAVDCGIGMQPSSLLDNTHFMTERFDRVGGGKKVHVHSLCGLMGLDYNRVGEYSYEQYFLAARKLGLGQDSLEQAFRRMAFNVLAHNCDDHTKNLSFCMDEMGKWSLSPAFDVCYSYDNSNEWMNGHNMMVNGKRKDITARDILEVGKKFNIKRRQGILKQVTEVVNGFAEYARANKVKKNLIKAVEANRPRL